MEWLEQAIISYIKNNSDKRLNSLDIMSHFKLRVDITYSAIESLENKGLVVRHNGPLGGWNGNHHYEVA